MSERIRLIVKPTAGGDKLEKLVEPQSTIEELKQALAPDCAIPADMQRLIYRGQILRDERTISSYGIEADHVLHLVRGKQTGAVQGPGGSSPSASAAAAPASGVGVGTGGSAGTPSASAAPGGLPHPLAGMMDPGMQQMLQSPLMQQLLSNPELVRRMLQMNPAVRELMDRDPQMAQLLNNPELLRESMSIVSNPSLMREYMRNNDRALSNLEALPGGFNALRQLYENVQEPLMSATAGGAQNPLASLLQGGAGGGSSGAAAGGAAAGGAADQPGTQPLPNPWAPQGATAGAGADAAAPVGLPDLAALLGQSGGGAAAAAGGASGAPPGMAELTSQMLENPAMRESMVAMMSQPGMVDMLTAANPQLRGLLESVPGVRAMLQSPEMLRTMLSPEMMRAMAGMQQRMGGGGGGGGAGGMPPALDPAALASMLAGVGANSSPGGAAGGGPGGMQGLMGLLGAMQMGLGGGLGGLGGPAPVADPETVYATQIQQLRDMGFFDGEANVRALQATGGNVNAAVERLLQGP